MFDVDIDYAGHYSALNTLGWNRGAGFKHGSVQDCGPNHGTADGFSSLWVSVIGNTDRISYLEKLRNLFKALPMLYKPSTVFHTLASCRNKPELKMEIPNHYS